MTDNEKWNKICEEFDRNINSSEDKIQKTWEKILSERFAYSSLDGEIEAQRKIKIGSTERIIPDIIIKNQNKDLFVVELKQEKSDIAQNTEQLLSYLKQLKCDLGVLVCNKICLIDYDYNISDEEQTKFEIEFTKDNPDGIKFVELFNKENFNSTVVKEFIKKQFQYKKNIETIKKDLEKSHDLVIPLLEKYFLEKNYSTKEFNEAIKEFEIRIEKKHHKIATSFFPISGTVNKRACFADTPNSDDEKLLRNLRTVGFSTFLKYFEYFINYDTREIKNIMKANEDWAPNSLNTKSSTGKRIINLGFGKRALSIIANSQNTDTETIEKARQLLDSAQ